MHNWLSKAESVLLLPAREGEDLVLIRHLPDALYDGI